MSRAVIIGGGAAGLLASGFLSGAGIQTIVVESRERPARKILVTGKGRCNLTNSCTTDEFIKNVRKNPKFMFSAINAFTPANTIELFESLGVPLKTERGRRVFPVSDKAMDIADALVSFSLKNGAQIRHAKAESVIIKDGRAAGVELVDGTSILSDAVLIATGGKSYPDTGSDGSGYHIAEMAGHTITPLRPSLIDIECSDGFCSRLAGLSLKNVVLTLKNSKNKLIYSELGEMLFTHTGISGPLVLSASAYMDDDPESYNIEIDLKPGLTSDQLDARLIRDISDNQNKEIETIISSLMPKALCPIVLGLSGVAPRIKGNQVSKDMRISISSTLKKLTLSPVKLGDIERAVVTSGGVSIKEVSPSNMQSKIVPGLFFAGEILDVDCFTGGYNLQAAFSTAYLAFSGINEYLKG